MIDFSMLIHAMHGPIASGRTHGMLLGAPTGATILGVHKQHISFMRDMARKLNRFDIGFALPVAEQLMGKRGPVLIDHYTSTWLFSEAAKEIDAKNAEIARLTELLGSALQTLARIESAAQDKPV